MAGTHIFNGLQQRKLKIYGSNLIPHGHSILGRLSCKQSLSQGYRCPWFVEGILYLSQKKRNEVSRIAQESELIRDDIQVEIPHKMSDYPRKVPEHE